ncbi:DUF1461 domain-containing protein [Candidatus Thiothrix sp. Deng01]|uniref:DUF1461 domain-containing protein n=1 Tax=Candidatus Thiothrix phosphatis TaxID=3112415 RepID=A0ABU6CTT1_9GAMM|nr:DUF1461 domain-containing protein [Candidatus Thiothrix sp. Deng01]MEB4590218.1 DUF1461 domain-containing protein [Candidatus Thiothrix sp. Deng01]
MGAAVARRLLTWMAGISLVLAIFLGVWVVLLHVYPWLPEASPQRQAIVAYLLRGMGNDLPDLPFLNPGEAFHLLDVRQLFARLDQLSAVVLLSCLSLLYAQKRFAGGRVMLRAGYLGLAFILLPLALMLAGGFVPLFIVLHTLLFPPNTWVFPDDSILVQLFPLDYFFRFGLAYVGTLAAIFIALVVWGHTRKPSA